MKLFKLEKYNCPACNILTNVLEGMELKFDSTNVEDHPDVAAKYEVMSLPVLLLLDEEDKELGRLTGKIKGTEIEDLLKKHGAAR